MEETLRGLVDDARGAGASFAEVRYADVRRQSVEWRDGEVRSAVPGEERGASVRVLVDGCWGFASTNQVTDARLRDALDGALSAARALAARPGDRVTLADAPAVTEKVAWTPREDATRKPVAEVAGALADAEATARDVDARVRSVKLTLNADVARTRYWNSDGSDIAMEVPHLLLQYEVVARPDGGEPVGYRARIGGTRGWDIFSDEDPLERARHAAEGAVRLLDAKPCPSGRMTVIADPTLTGVFAHECIGHACEGDLVTAGESILEGRLGETVGSDAVTVVDDGGITGSFGSLPFDDEGVRADRKVLVEDGVLRGYILSRETAGKLGMTPNGGARAEGVTSPPLVRMSNTMIEGGDHAFEELLEGVEHGIYAKGTRGGQVDVAKGSFQFGAQEAWLIENGELTTPLRDAALQGSILETLATIDAVGRDAALAEPGICGKGQWVPVGDGGPHIRIRGATVGGGA